jgi:hypothetical protein
MKTNKNNNYKVIIKPSYSNPNKYISKWDFGNYDFIITYRKNNKRFLLFKKTNVKGYLKAVKLSNLKLNKLCNQRKTR